MHVSRHLAAGPSLQDYFFQSTSTKRPLHDATEQGAEQPALIARSATHPDAEDAQEHVGSVLRSPDPNTSAKVSRYKWEGTS